MSSDIPPALTALKHFLSIGDTSAEVLQALIELSIRRKAQFRRGEWQPVLRGKTLAMIFQKSSLRTRLAFEAAMTQLGGHAIYLEDRQVGVDQREDVRDMARVTSSMCDGICARVFGHEIVENLARHGTVPVINALSDWAHPCQALADMMTLQERFGRLAGLKLTYVGDANNVARSLLNACTKLGLSVTFACPEGYQLEKSQMESALPAARETGAAITLTDKPAEAAADADVIYTDVWTSMGQEAQRELRERVFADFQVNAALLKRAKSTAVVMHCLPAHRNLEITDDMLDGPASVVFQQAENRLHTTRALLEVLLGSPKPG